MEDLNKIGGKTPFHENRNRFQTLVEMSPEAIYVHDGKNIIYVNDAAVKLFGVESGKQLLGRSPYELYPPEYLPKMRERMSRLLAGHQVPIIEKRVWRSDGSTIDVEIRASCFYENNMPVVQVLLLDITDRKKAEEALRRHVIELAVANQNLEAFGYLISHDLRNPLQGILACCEVLKDVLHSKDKEVREALNHILCSAKQMSQIISGLMSLSSITRQEMKLTQCALSDMARSIIEELKELDENRAVEVIIGPLVFADADPGLIKILMENLFRNAWKFTSKKPNARIEFGKQYEKETAVYYIRDNGVGFDMAHAERLFEPFQRLHSKHEYAGTGIGLTIVKRIAEKHGGKVWVNAEKDKGATFYFTLTGASNPASSN